MKIKYQVFVSSTHDDLIEERKAVSQALLESGCIPAGMELFPASNKSSWEIIKNVIVECDYFILIVAGRYGSLGTDDVYSLPLCHEIPILCQQPVDLNLILCRL